MLALLLVLSFNWKVFAAKWCCDSCMSKPGDNELEDMIATAQAQIQQASGGDGGTQTNVQLVRASLDDLSSCGGKVLTVEELASCLQLAETVRKNCWLRLNAPSVDTPDSVKIPLRQVLSTTENIISLLVSRLSRFPRRLGHQEKVSSFFTACVAGGDLYANKITSNSFAEGAFRLLQGAAYRVAQGVTWCYSTRNCTHPDGKSYDAMHLEILTRSLFSLFFELDILVPCKAEALSFLSLLDGFYARPPADDWWVDTWTPRLLQALACRAPTDQKRQDWYPLDVLESNDAEVWQAFYLFQSYARSPKRCMEYEQLYQNESQFFMTNYVPFLDVENFRTKMRSNDMRVGFASYLGPSLWNLFHGLARQISEKATATAQGNLTESFKTFFTAFSHMQRCPYCRQHFLSRVSVNDVMYADDVLYLQKDADGNFTAVRRPRVSNNQTFHYTPLEVSMYPLEWLFIAGRDYTLEGKLASVVDGKSLELFLWKLHNAVSSTVAKNMLCYPEELADHEIHMGCKVEGLGNSLKRQEYWRSRCSTWPWSTRFRRGFDIKHLCEPVGPSQKGLWQARE